MTGWASSEFFFYVLTFCGSFLLVDAVEGFSLIETEWDFSELLGAYFPIRLTLDSSVAVVLLVLDSVVSTLLYFSLW